MSGISEKSMNKLDVSSYVKVICEPGNLSIDTQQTYAVKESFYYLWL